MKGAQRGSVDANARAVKELRAGVGPNFKNPQASLPASHHHLAEIIRLVVMISIKFRLSSRNALLQNDGSNILNSNW